MPATEYETRTDSVLAWKRAQKLGRFDPDAPTVEQQKIRTSEREIEERGKCHVVPLWSLCVNQCVCTQYAPAARRDGMIHLV